MSLPSLEGLERLTAAEWHELRERLKDAGLNTASVAPFTQVGRAFPEPFRRPLVAWHLRRADEPSTVAMRLFMFRDAVTGGEAEALLGQALFRQLVESGLVAESAVGFTCPWDLNILEQLLILCDDLTAGGKAVMGAGVSSLIACRAAFPLKPIGSILDLGCGAGTSALAYASWAQRVVGTDINPRAVRLSRINAVLNDTRVPSFLVGDRFSAVRDERFDLIVSQPPFIARAPKATRATFLHGGARGDELPLRILREIPAHLAEGGRAVLLVDWPEDGCSSVEERVLDAVGDGLQVLVLRCPGMPLDDHCIAYAIGPGNGGAAYRRRVVASREHLASLGITGLTSSVIVLRRLAPSWTAVVTLPAGGIMRAAAARIEPILVRETLLAGPEREFLESRHTIAEGLQFLALPDGRVRAEFPATALFDRAEMNSGAYRLIQMASAAPSVDATIDEFSRQAEIARAEAAGRTLPAIREALRRGILEPVLG